MNKPLLPNPNQELIEAVTLFERIKSFKATSMQAELLKSVCDTQLLFSQALVDSLSVAPGGLTMAEMNHARKNELIPAVTLIKKRLGCGINEAKELYKKWQRDNNVDPCLGQG